MINSKFYLYRRGNGNEGNFERALVEVTTDNAYNALKALVCNDYIEGSDTRKYIEANLEIDGEETYTIYAHISEGPQGQTEFGSAWLTAELTYLQGKDLEYYQNRRNSQKLEDLLDEQARSML